MADDKTTSYLTPEARARIEIDRMLAAAGWAVQNASQVNLAAARGVAVREFVHGITARPRRLPAVPRRSGRRRGRGEEGGRDADRRRVAERKVRRRAP